MNPTFNPEVYGTTGWPKFAVPMIAGKNGGVISEYNTAFDGLIGIVKKGANAGGVSSQYLTAFNALAVQLHSLGVLVLDGKGTI